MEYERADIPARSLPKYVVIWGKGMGIRTREFMAWEYDRAVKYANEKNGKLKTFNRKQL